MKTLGDLVTERYRLQELDEFDRNELLWVIKAQNDQLGNNPMTEARWKKLMETDIIKFKLRIKKRQEKIDRLDKEADKLL